MIAWTSLSIIAHYLGPIWKTAIQYKSDDNRNSLYFVTTYKQPSRNGSYMSRNRSYMHMPQSNESCMFHELTVTVHDSMNLFVYHCPLPGPLWKTAIQYKSEHHRNSLYFATTYKQPSRNGSYIMVSAVALNDNMVAPNNENRFLVTFFVSWQHINFLSL